MAGFGLDFYIFGCYGISEDGGVRRMNRLSTVLLAALLIVLCVSVACTKSGDKPTFVSQYQAVFLDNGQVFFGKIENAGADYPLLRDVFYVQNQQDPETRHVKSILIKRGAEWHGRT